MAFKMIRKQFMEHLQSTKIMFTIEITIAMASIFLSSFITGTEINKYFMSTLFDHHFHESIQSFILCPAFRYALIYNDINSRYQLMQIDNS